jgi:D-3-phosphoglycerate dehydrogenase
MPHKLVFTDSYPTLDGGRKVFVGTKIEILDCNGMCGTEDRVIEYAEDADALVTQFVPMITRRVMAHLTRCKVIVRLAIGLDSIDLRAATERRTMVGLDLVKACRITSFPTTAR